MKEIIAKTDIKREKGYLYFTATDERGNITVCRTEMAHGKKKKSK